VVRAIANSRNGTPLCGASADVQPTALDLEFVRFQRTRAPEALGAVFDGTAPRLLLVAMHLCRDAAAAEDLVQTVFLQALRDVDRYDGRRPVLAWLLGILEHRAHDHRRRARRRREQTDAEAAARVDPAPGPERLAADAEVRRQVAHSLECLPADYRSVLTLRLVHGLRAVDIAHAHGVPPATVRTRLHRGLALLRQALPRSLATPLLLALLGAEALRARDGLPAIKANLLRAIPGGAPVAVAGAALAKWLVGALAAAAAAVLIALAIAPSAPTPLAGARSAAGVAPASGEAVARSADAGAALAANSDTQRERVAAPPARDARTTVLHGRVVDAASHAPLADAQVRLTAEADPMRGEAPADWRDPEPIVTGGDGAFAFAIVPPPALWFTLRVDADGRVEELRSFASLRQGVDADLGDLALAPGTMVRLGVDVDGRPCPGVSVLANPAAQAERGSMNCPGNTDAHGEVDLGGGLRCTPGRWRYEIEGPFAGATTGEFEVPLQKDPWTFRVALRRPPPELSVTGTVVDQTGAPVSGLQLWIPIPDVGDFTAKTGADGAFAFAVRHLWEGHDRWHIELPKNRPDLEWVADGGELAWGRQDLRLVVRRRAPATLQLEVVDERGAPVETFGASCWPDPWRLRSGEMPQLRGVAPVRHEGGRCTLADLPPGPAFASVFGGAAHGERAEIPVELAEGALVPLRVVLAAPADLAVDVVAVGSGAPLAGVELALAKVVPATLAAKVTAASQRCDLAVVRRGGGGSSGPQGFNVLTLARATSDRDGVARLRAMPDTPALVLFVDGGRGAAKIVHDVRLPAGGARLRIEVEPAAQVRGIVRPAAFVQRYGPAPEALARATSSFEVPDPQRLAFYRPEVQLRRVASATREIYSARTDADGAFAFAGLPAGRYEARIHAIVPYESGVRSASYGPLGTIDVDPAAAQPCELALDVGRFVPGRARAAVFVDGSPWTGGAGVALCIDRGVGNVDCRREADGTFVSPWLEPGRYVAFACVPRADGGCHMIYGTEPFVVAPDGDVQVTASLQRRAVELTVLDAQDRPQSLRVVLQPLDHPEFATQWQDGERTGADGRVRFDPAPPGRLRVCALAPDQDPNRRDATPALVLGELGDSERVATLRVPQ
jgi:RNA polymerase sigma-70 factor (ECF subfamily)